MSQTSSSTVVARSLPFALPITTSLLGLLGIGGGVYNFINPSEGAKAFGILMPPSEGDLRSNAESQARQRAYIQIHGIRNISNGIGLLGLIGYLNFSKLCQTSPLAAVAVRRSLGILLTTGTIVALVDGWVLSKFTRADGISDDAKDLSVKQSKGHTFMAFPVLALGLAWLYA